MEPRIYFTYRLQYKRIIATAFACVIVGTSANAIALPLKYEFTIDTPTHAKVVLEGDFLTVANAQTGTSFSLTAAYGALANCGANGHCWTSTISFTKDSIDRWHVQTIIGQHQTNPHGAEEAVFGSILQVGNPSVPGLDQAFALQTSSVGTEFGLPLLRTVMSSHPAIPNHKDIMTAQLVPISGIPPGPLGALGPSPGGEIKLNVRFDHVTEPPALALFCFGLACLGFVVRQTRVLIEKKLRT